MLMSLTDVYALLQIFLGLGLLCLMLMSGNLLFLAIARHVAPTRVYPTRSLSEAALPAVLVQLPLYNEGDLAQRLLEATAQLDWPRDRLYIQILDDSTDGSLIHSQQAVAWAKAQGLQVELLHRTKRHAYKAGALAEGLKRLPQVPYVAMFDADFMPPRDFLRRTVALLEADHALAFVQGRWVHANRPHNLLTRVQAMLLDGHFRVEQETRARLGLPLAFNGTCGMWRCSAIDSAGGWQGDTLSEDLDLSMRVHLAGWRAAYLHDLGVPGELPVSAQAWRTQQARWTKGFAQCTLKLAPTIWRSTWPGWHKLAVSLQMGQSLFFPLGLVCLLLSLPLLAAEAVLHPLLMMLGTVATLLGFAGTMGFLITGQRWRNDPSEPKEYQPVAMVALSLIFTSGLVLSNARAVLEALIGRPSEFVRTPKGQMQGARPRSGYPWKGVPELAVAVALISFILLEQAWSGLFMSIMISGLASVGTMQLLEARLNAAKPPR